jgi:hypothetical protein
MATGSINKLKLSEIDLESAFKLVSYGATTASGSPYGWTINITQAGYTPVSFSINHGNSGSIFLAAETFNATTLAGYCSKGSTALAAKVFYVKTSMLTV